MSQEDVTAARYGDRAGDFIRSASILCGNVHDGWLPSAGLLLGFGCELLAKQRLLLIGVPKKALCKSPYGHNISGMWRVKTTLFAEAECVVSELKQNPNQNGVDASFDWGLHFDQLAQGHSSESSFSLRYHHGQIHFPDPKALTVVLENIWLIEQKNKGLNGQFDVGR